MLFQGYLALVCAFYTLYTATAQTGVCYSHVSSVETRTEYFQSSYRNSYSCGLFGWRTCRRTLYRPSSREISVTVYNSVFGCCSGYEQVGSSMACQPVCAGGCLNDGVCTSPNTCQCVSGWTGTNCEQDIDECTSGANSCGQVCNNNPGSYTCSCMPGYRLNSDALTCAEINECLEGTDTCQQNCMNTDGSFSCTCNTGYSLSSDQFSCINDDECTLGTSLCVQICDDIEGSYTCTCHVGYTLDSDGYSCSDIDECTDGTNTCEQNCHNNEGSYTCSCNSGYTLNVNQRTCDDINECASPDHGCQDICINFPGAYRCECNIGYMLNADERTCSDIDECATGTHTCDHNCHNNIGSFTCTCRPGTNLDADGFTCNDIDECQRPDINNCQQVCSNIEGTYSCACYPGYLLGTDASSCSDIDECATGTHTCEQVCWNTVGSYTCSCGDGYNLNADLSTCDDIDECADGTSGCAEICTNTMGGFECSCREGYGLTEDGYNCTDVDECASNTTNRCDQDCTNTIGSYTCSCGAGFIIDVDGSTCDDVDECGGDHMCMEACRNTPGSFECACRAGYVLNDDGRSCRDVDECEEEIDQCEQDCFNTEGSYLCSCSIAYTLNFDGFRCDDLDECQVGLNGDTTCDEVCVNTIGSYTCGCNPGRVLVSNGVSCRDENECTEGEHQCDQMCIDAIGSYTCSCNSTTTLNPDGFRCDDINECALGIDNCAEVCMNVYGSHYCSCNDSGYGVNSDGITCSDVNECLLDIDQCEHTCTNTDNSYTCQCNDGYTLTSNNFNCLGSPEDIVFDTVESTTMTLTWGLPANDSDDGNILSYPVICNSDGHESFSLDLTVPVADERLAVLQSLLPYTAYNCCVSVQTDRGTSPSFCIMETTLEDAPSTIPESVTLINDEIDSLTITFQPPVIPNGVIIAYTFYVRFKNGSLLILVDRSLTGTFTIEGLQPYQLVEVQVSANTSVGEGPLSVPDTTRTAQSVPSAPTRVAVEVVSNSSFTVTWDPPLMPNGILLSYTVSIYNHLNNYREEVIQNISTTSTRTVTVNDLEPFIPYTIEMTATTIVGEGELTSQIAFTEHGVPDIPTLNTVVRLSEGVVKVLWTPLTPDEARGVLTQLEIIYQPASGGQCLTINENSTQLMMIDENIDTQREAEVAGLDESLEYCVAIRVRTSAGESGHSNVLKAHYASDTYVQVRLKLPTHDICLTYITKDVVEKAIDVSSTVVDVLLLRCNCLFTVEHITHSRLLCGSNDKEVIYQANLLNTDGKTAPELMSLIQEWVDNTPQLSVGGALLEVDPYCSVNVTEVGKTEECDAVSPTIATTMQVSEVPLPGYLIPAIAGGVGGVFGIILLVLIATILICCCGRKGSNISRKSGRHTFDDGTQLVAQGSTSIVDPENDNVVSYSLADFDYGQEEEIKKDLGSNPLFEKNPEDEIKIDLGTTRTQI